MMNDTIAFIVIVIPCLLLAGASVGGIAFCVVDAVKMFRGQV